MYDVKISFDNGVYTFKMERNGQTTEFTMTAKSFESNGFALSGLLKEHHAKLDKPVLAATAPVTRVVSGEVRKENK